MPYSAHPRHGTHASRRQDVFEKRADYSPVRRRTAVREPTVDSQGRYIGPQDLERGLNYFFRHRSTSSPSPSLPLSRSSPSSPAPRPRSLERSGLNFEKLRELHQLREKGATLTDLAVRFKVSLATLAYHLRGSASMQVALSAV